MRPVGMLTNVVAKPSDRNANFFVSQSLDMISIFGIMIRHHKVRIIGQKNST